MNYKKKFILGLVVMIALVGLNIFSAHAANVSEEIGGQLSAAGAGNGADLGTYTDPRMIAANIIKIALGFIGIIFVVLMTYAGFLWMTAGGKDEQIEKSKSLLFQSVIGLIIILSAYSITILAVKLAKAERTTSPSSIIYIEQIQNGRSCGTSDSCEY